nr:non-ribosomal peptide synthetase [Aquimarina algiphila]
MDIIKMVPSHWYSLCSGDGIFLPDRSIIFGGEKLTNGVLDKIKESNSDVAVYNHYGPTETTVGKLIHKVDLDRDYTNIPIGKPFSNSGVYVLDSNMHLVPIGVVGELYIDGLGVSQGYLNNADLTTETFVSHPFNEGARMYKTGDLARWSEEGTIEFMGRADDQVKIRGHRVEVKEIESILNELDHISQSLVISQSDDSGSIRLIAYIVSDEAVLDIMGIDDALRGDLPDYMIPSVYEKLDAIPLTENGKVDYKALPKVTDGVVGPAREYVGPETDEEKALVAAWESVLKKERVSIKDNFYQLGGDSIKSLQVVARLRQYGFVLKVGDILGTPVLQEMIPMMEKVGSFIDQSEVEGEVILTPIQNYLFSSPNIPAPHHFNQSVLLKSKEGLDTKILADSISHLVRHHDALRMVYTQENGQWKQYNRKYTEDCYQVYYHDLREDKNALVTMGELCNKIQSSFDLAQGPLFVVGHFKVPDGDRLALICHHSVVDGVSWRILLEDLSSLYSQYQKEEELTLPLKTDSFQKWSLFQQEYAQSNTLRKERAYWEDMLAKDIPEFPINEVKQNDLIKSNKQVSFSLSRDMTSAIKTKIHHAYNTEINDVLLTALGLAILDVLGVNQSVLNMEGHGREDIIDGLDISRTVGWFTSHYPLVLEVSNSKDVIENLIKVKDDLRKIPNKGIGYGIVKYLTEGFSKELKQTIKFNYLGEFDNNPGGDNESPIFEYGSEYIGDWKDKRNGDDILLDISGMIASGILNITISYNPSLFEDEKIKSLIDAYQNHLTLLIESLATIKENHVTPSDLIFSDLTIEELDVLNADGTLENVYQLSPSQKGLYFHWLSSDDPRLYLTQFSYRIKIAALKAEHFQKAYDKLIERYAILRTSFTSKFQNTLLQIVQKDIPSRFNHEKCLDGMSIDEKNFWVEERKISDQLKGFNLEEPSQMRLTVLDLGNESYEFIWSYHHVVMDGWCTSILVNDYYKILQSIANDIDPKLPMSRPFSDYIQWLNKVGEEDTLTYWKDYLSGYNNVVEIPSKTTKLSNQKFENLEETLEISGGIYQKMDALCNNIGVTHYTFIQAVWGYLLSKYNDFQDVVFGSIVSGRPPNLEGVEDMVGLFMNTIPVRVNYKSKERIVDLLKKTQDDAITGLSHQYMSLAKVQGQSELGISLINHVMVFENYPIQELIEEQLGGKGHQGEKILELESTDLNKVQMNYDFSIIVKVYSDSLKLHFFYDGNRYDKTLIKKIGVHFKNVVKSFVQQPDQFLKDVDYLSKKEKHELLKEFNTTKIDYPFDKTVVDLFRKQVQNSPDATALIFKEKTLTYRELDEKSNQVAHYLHKKGVTAEYLIPICVKRSTDMIIGILGVLKAGGAYVPIDPAYPKQRIDFIIEDTDAKLILTTKKLEKQFQTYESSLNIICLDGLSTLDEELSIQPVESPVSPTQLAYLIYTSGSSGKPKGVKIEHKALMNFLFSMRDYLDFDEHLKLLSLTTFTFDISILEFLSPLLLGGKLVLISDTDSKNPDYVAQVIKETNPTCIQATPSHWQMLINEDWGDSKNITLLSGGESISEELKEQLVSKSNNVWNLYGPTETTIWSCIQKLEKEEKVTIGKPIANTQIYILDEHLSLTSRGAVGEICIGGLGLSRGYLNRPELTQEKFVTHPFVEGEKIYRTGDLGRWLPNGEIEFKGRKDYQVKIRGYRIELGEIESVLSTKEEIETAIVVAVESTSGDKDLVAYYTSSVAIELPELREYLQNYLPSFMIPSYFIEIEEFPLTANGKINKKALLKPEELELVGSTEYVAPNNEIEKKLVAIWEKVLGREQVGVKDDFFDLGGHSLKVIRLINEYHKVFDVKLTIENVFSNRQLETHAALLFSSEKRDHKLIPVIPESSSYPISDAQRRLWVLSQFKGGSASYNMPSSLSLNDNFNISNFKKSIMSVLDRHEILRTVFREDLDGVVHQVILDVNDIGLEIKEENYTQLHDPEEQAKRYIEEDSYTPFDLKEGPLLRISLLQVSDSDYVFYFNMHHIISDGWSMRVLARDVMTYYDHYSTGSHLELSPLRIQYKDYASWQQAQLGTDEYKIHRNYWLDKFSGNPSLIDLPTDKTRPLMKTHNGRHLSTYFGTEDTHLIRDYIEENEGTLFMFLLSSLKVLLHRYTGEEDIIVGSPIAGRDHSDLEDQIGFYTNTLPIRTNIIGSTTFEKLYENVKQELLEAYSHQIYPFDRLVEELDLIRDTGRSALFDILVILQNLDENIDISEIHKEDIGLIKDHGNVMSRFDIEFNFKEEGECLRLDLTYNTDVYDDEMIRGFISHYQKLIKLLITERERCINEIDYLQDEERKELLYDFNSTFLDYPDDKTVIDLFEEQVLKTPNKVALVHKGKKLSYKKIDELSNQLAYRLRSKNIIGACVGVILDRSEDFVISMLAIMRLGKIYVPIDLNYPLERIKYILKDSQITHIVGDLNLEIVEELNDVYDIIPVRSFDKLNAPSKINHSKITEDAFVIYTSGSTGIPKGVVQTHKMLKNLILWDFSVDGIRRDLKCLQYTSFSFDVSLQDVYGVLLNGGELHLVSEQLKLDFISLKDYIISESIEVLAFPYAAMIGFFNVNAAEDFTGNKIQQIVSAGEQLILTEGLNEFLKMNPSVNLHNHYGPSETHVVTSYTYQKLTDVYKDRKDVLIGKPISNTSVYIVNDSHVLQPKGVTGEIYIGGAGLASGYLNREDLTKERFIINPFEEGELVYKTGDLGKWLPDGNIEFLGRIDDQVKIRGYRIELSEIESALDQIKTIKQSIVLAKEDNKGNKQLTAYIVSDEKNDRLKIQDYLRTKLPDYMVPRSYIILKEMPLTSNGKVDKKSLPDPDRSTFERRKYVPPTTEIEIKLTKIWQEVLSIEEIGVKDHFFELGGNSLDAIKVISKMRKELDLEIDIQILFQFNTIADLAFQIGFSLNQKAIKKENKTLNEIKI